MPPVLSRFTSQTLVACKFNKWYRYSISSFHSNFGRLRVNVQRKRDKLRCFSSIVTENSNLKASTEQRTDLEIQNGKLSEGTSGTVLTFQEAIQRLQDYWSKTGCAILQPCNTEVGAGTMNPATFLRVLGPEPWKVAYVEPSVRPDDSRYGENPNRVQMHTQFQVILKPDPGRAQELYLGSLGALGLDSGQCDVRFVEDNWESPVLGAWGLGWEVWLNGMEISQFTYFQQAGSISVNPVSVEITYGLERIIMSLQGVDHFKKILYSPGVTYGELFLQNEREMSGFNLEHADVARVQKMFDLYDEEARALLGKGLPIPAYAHVLKTSHAFNILDARGAIGVTERARFFAKMRNLARECAQLWVSSREALGFPLGSAQWGEESSQDSAELAPPDESQLAGLGPRAFVLEIGSEELPPDDVSSAVDQMEKMVPALLTRLRLEHSTVEVSGTPRRLSVAIADLAQRQEDTCQRVRGPPKSKAFDSQGNPSKALEGFCRKNKVTTADISIVPDDKGVEYVYADVAQPGRVTWEVLSEELPAVISQLSFPRTMRWNSPVAYSRPIRWLLCLHGDHIVPFRYAGLYSGRSTRLLRNAPLPQAEVKTAEEYLSVVSSGDIVLSIKDRKDKIWDASSALATSVGGKIPEECRGALLDEVANLVESPYPLLGQFSEKFLELPREVLETVMKKHQRYFPVEEEASGKLLPFFLAVPNGQLDEQVVRTGNQAVLRARYEDARFFYDSDCSQPLISFRDKLEGITFQERLGSLLSRSERIESLVVPTSSALYPPNSDSSPLDWIVTTAAEAAPLAMADLGTSLVAELTNLAGIMGRHYSLREGRSSQVAEAVFESVLPRFAGDKLPETPPGVVLSVASRLDSLVGLFSVGCEPTSSADPFGLRRSAYALVETLVQNKAQVDLPQLFSFAAKVQPVEVTEEVLSQVLTFVVRRLEQLLIDSGNTVEIVRAVLAERGNNPSLAAVSVSQMEEAYKSGELEKVISAYARPTRIVRGKEIDSEWEVNESFFETEEEKALWSAYLSVRGEVNSISSVVDFIRASEPLYGPLDNFFSNVFVMAENEQVRKNRLSLVKAVADLPNGIVDLSVLPGF